jgi:hypothetical protein
LRITTKLNGNEQSTDKIKLQGDNEKCQQSILLLPDICQQSILLLPDKCQQSILLLPDKCQQSILLMPDKWGSSSVASCTTRTKHTGPSWSRSYDSWIYNYLCNQCLSPLTLRVLRVLRFPRPIELTPLFSHPRFHTYQ